MLEKVIITIAGILFYGSIAVCLAAPVVAIIAETLF